MTRHDGDQALPYRALTVMLDKQVGKAQDCRSSFGGRMAQSIQVTVTIGDKQVKLDGPEDFVRSEVQRLTNLLVSTDSRSRSSEDSESVALGNERQFVSLKKPIGHPETVAVLAFYLTESGQREFTSEDIRRAYIRAVVKPPKVIDQALRDAKNVRDFLEPVGRGRYKLSPHGDRYVRFDLPRKDNS
jgi:hypothetical protein